MIEYEGSIICVDPSLNILQLIGKKYTVMIIGVIGNKINKKNFNEILNDIPFSSSTIISRRLKDLQRSGLIIRLNEAEGVGYTLTELGYSVRKALLPLLKLMETRS
ncbi:transcription regulator [mine drainage metagenome]|uniref:Transcription regulator n=1 Tax=mine drainage metagenome TaxID=410659 RepID=T0YV03_9ZZZZ